uniref:Checkpoint protein n=1 Tax=Lepisosteus oculatus TaxID=7918 RepID=W5N6Y6_LEPOC
MKFRSKIVDVVCLQHFTRVVSTISKLTKTCTLRLTTSNLYFILCDKVANGGVSMWCELSQGNFFDEFQLEGVSPDANEIYLKLAPENLSRALKTANNAKSLKIKLTKKHCPCITLAVELVSLQSKSLLRSLTAQSDVLSVLSGLKQKEPHSAFFLSLGWVLPVCALYPLLKRTYCSSLSQVLEANRNGEMNLKIETDLVSVATHFKNLENPPWEPDGDESQGPSQDRHPETMAEARIDIRKLQQFLAGQQVNPCKAVCNIVSGRIVHFILLHEDVSLQYFIPAVA